MTDSGARLKMKKYNGVSQIKIIIFVLVIYAIVLLTVSPAVRAQGSGNPTNSSKPQILLCIDTSSGMEGDDGKLSLIQDVLTGNGDGVIGRIFEEIPEAEITIMTMGGAGEDGTGAALTGIEACGRDRTKVVRKGIAELSCQNTAGDASSVGADYGAAMETAASELSVLQAENPGASISFIFLTGSAPDQSCAFTRADTAEVRALADTWSIAVSRDAHAFSQPLQWIAGDKNRVYTAADADGLDAAFDSILGQMTPGSEKAAAETEDVVAETAVQVVQTAATERISPAVRTVSGTDPVADARYSVYTSWKDAVDENNALGTVTTKADGAAGLPAVDSGTVLWIRETAAPAGYDTDRGIYKVTLGDDANTVVRADGPDSFSEIAEGEYPVITRGADPVITFCGVKTVLQILIVCEDGETSAQLDGAEYTIYSDEAMTQAVETVVSEYGGVPLGQGCEQGQDYYVRETKAPDGYAAGQTEFRFRYTLAGDETEFTMTPVSGTEPASGAPAFIYTGKRIVMTFTTWRQGVVPGADAGADIMAAGIAAFIAALLIMAVMIFRSKGMSAQHHMKVS